MTQTDLWDGLVPTRDRFMQRTFAWGTSDPSVWPEDAWFINIPEETLKQYRNGLFEAQWLPETAVIDCTLGLT